MTLQVIGLICIGILTYYHSLIDSLLGWPVGLLVMLTASIAYAPTILAAPPESVLVGVTGYLLVMLIAWTASISGFGL